MEEVERDTARGVLRRARTLAGELGRSLEVQDLIETALGQYNLARERNEGRWIEDFRVACRLYLRAPLIERHFPGVLPSFRDRSPLETSRPSGEARRERRSPARGSGRGRDSRELREVDRRGRSRDRRPPSDRVRDGYRSERRGSEAGGRRSRASDRVTPPRKVSHGERQDDLRIRISGRSETEERRCPVGRCQFEGSVEAHVRERHLPTLFQNPNAHGARRSKRRLGALRRLARILTGMGSPWRLMDLWNRDGPRVDNSSLPGQQALEDLCQAAGWVRPSRFRLWPMNSPALLIHWRVLIFLLDQMRTGDRADWKASSVDVRPARTGLQTRRKRAQATSRSEATGDSVEEAASSASLPGNMNSILASWEATEEMELDYTGTPSPDRHQGLDAVEELSQQEEARLLKSPAPESGVLEGKSLEEAVTAVGGPPKRSPPVTDMAFLGTFKAFDSHLHLDRLAWRKQWTWEEAAERLGSSSGTPPDHPVNLSGGVMVFCDPESYDKLPFTREAYTCAVGIHPKKVPELTEKRAGQLRQLLERPEVKAFGEVGLDRQTPPETWKKQEEVLERILPWCRPNQTLVLHLRGSASDLMGDEVLDRGLALVQRTCPREQPIHLHCFSGTKGQVQKWLEAFPNCYFGFTGLVLKFKPPQKDGLKAVPMNRLLVETDSPYLSPIPTVTVNTPAYLGEVAYLVAQIRGEALSIVLSCTEANARHLYQ